MSNRVLVAVTAASLSICASAGEIFVDAKNGKDGEGRGSEAAPYLTIQAAVDAAKAGDTITLFPGDYTNGVTTTKVSIDSKNRVVIDKKLTIRSKEGRKSRDATRIVGAWDETESNDRPWGMGPNAIRCVWVTANATGTRFEGITFLRGSTPYDLNQGNDTSGGGIMFYNNSYGTIVDCAFVECQGGRGGGVYSDKYQADNELVIARTIFRGCRGGKFGYALRGGTACNCVFDDNRRTCLKDGSFKGDGNAKGATSYIRRAVNCTFVNNEEYGSDANVNGALQNCVFVNNSSGDISGSASSKLYYCVNNSSHTGNGCVSVTFTSSSEVYSPLDGDYRLVKGAKSILAGNMEYVTGKIPEEFRSTDYYGNPRTTDGKVSCGAVQTVVEQDASGVAFTWYNSGDWLLDGKKADFSYRTFVAREGWPVPFHVEFAPKSGTHLVRYIRSADTVWPMMGGDAYVTTSRAGQVQTMTVATTATAFWTDPVNGNDGANDGSEAHPFKTLQKAVGATAGAHVVYAKAGDYKDGGATLRGLMSRLAVPDTLAGTLRVVAVDGPEKTFITGKAGTHNATYGYGDDAERCVAVASTNSFCAVIQGFTLRGGRASDEKTDWASYGGALANVDSSANSLGTAYLLDCVISDCSAPRAVCFGGTLMRCRVTRSRAGNTGNNNGIMRNVRVYSSLITDCPNSTSDSTYVLGPGARAYNCTIVGNTPGGITDYTSNKAYAYNSVFGKRNNTNPEIARIPGDQFQYCLYRASSSVLDAPTSVIENPVRFADDVRGDYRLAPDSAGIALGSAGSLSVPVDVDGRPFEVSDDGRLVAGCFARIVPTSYYVDADQGDDGNDGLTEGSALKTLAEAASRAGFGDTITALPGTYSTGTMLPLKAETGGDVEPTLPARVVLHRNVTLQSRDGAEVTVITGDEATGGGCGADAVRCAFLARDAKLKGFTLSGGCTAATDEKGTQIATVNNYGGGVACCAGAEATAEEYSALVADCVITNCQALRGGGASYGIYWNCRFFGNTLCATKPGFAVRNAKVVGCLFAANGSSGSHSTVYDCDLVNCTVRGSQAQASGAVLNEGGYGSKRSMVNTICVADKFNVIAVTNCVLGTTTRNLAANPAVKNIIAGGAKLNADGSIKRRSSAVDAADESIVPDWFLAGKDLAGTDRVMGERLDIGAFEYDSSIPVPGALLLVR